ncbi:tRNA dihydrouridine synthase DusB [Candidatus Ventrimonas sp.]|jgi:tRNA-dihydrouridine synthase B|uniref:tRNA dihydrouridine synthase DusB n=1 Tax=Candidatus Ventrimonas sp. TaxID=3048889 RepID=UPI003AB6C42B
MKLRIGNVELDNNLILAPMAGVTDMSFRQLCREQGCGLLVTEMVSAKAILYKNRNTKELMAIGEGERPVSLQLFGSDPEIVSDIAHQVEDGPYDIIDLNMGCPVPKIVGNGEGSALMKNPKLVEELLSALVRKVHKPVTVKFRKGFDDDHVNAVEIAKIAESCGVAAVAVHGRTREQYYSGRADWDIIRQVKEAVKIPVIGNGDIFEPQDAKRMLEETGCDGLMIGRGARGNPWIFKRIQHYLETGEVLPPPGPVEVGEMILRHTRIHVAFKGEYIGMKEMRKHIAWYTAGLPHSSSIRRECNMLETEEELVELLKQHGMLDKESAFKYNIQNV